MQSLESLIREALQHPCIDETIGNDTQTPAPDPQHHTIETDSTTDDAACVPDFPEFEPSYYYGLAGEVSALAIENSEAAQVAVYMSFLVMEAALLGKDKYIRVGETKHYARINSALVGASSRARKGTSLKPVQRILREAEALAYEPSLMIANGGLSSAEGLIYQVRDESEKKDKNGVPEWEGVTDKRLLVVEEELGNVFKQCQREGNTLSPLLRRIWDLGNNDVLAPMTKNSKLSATAPHINILGHITQHELKCLMSHSDIHNGLANRFLWCCVRRSKKLAFPLPMDDNETHKLAVRLSDAIKHTRGGNNEITLSKSARDYWDVKYHELSHDKYGAIGSITSRAEAYALRLALLFCLLDCSDQIEHQHLKAACDLVEFCNLSAEYIFNAPTDYETNNDAQKLLNALAEKPMTQTEISKLFNGHKKRDELITMLKELQSMSKIESKPDKSTRKPKTYWHTKKPV